MIRDALFSNRAGLILWLMIVSLFGACQPADHAMTTTAPQTFISSPTPPIVQVTAIQPPSSPTVTPKNLATAVPESDISQSDLLALKATPTQSPTATPTPDPDAILITDEPIFVGGDVRVQGWSPDGRYLSYFEYTEEQIAQSPVSGLRGTVPGAFTFYDTVTGQKCQRYPLDGGFPYEGPGRGQRFTWLPNGDLLIFTTDEQVIQADAPCGQDENLTAHFPERMQNIASHSPDERLLLLTGATAYWLYNIESHAIYSIAEITPDSFNNLIWSPEGTYIGVTLAGDYAGNRSSIGGSRVVDVSTGQIIARYDWEPANALDGTFGGPVWLNENEMVITVSLDQGPFFMTVGGEVRPLLPLFDLFDIDFERGRYIPHVDVFVEPTSGHYHLLLSDMGWSEEKISPQVYHSDTSSVEMLDISGINNVYLQADGSIVVYSLSPSVQRQITAVGDSWQPVTCAPVWYVPTTRLLAQNVGVNRVDIDIYSWPDCQLQAKLQLVWDAKEYDSLNTDISLDGRMLAILPTDEYSRGQALFVVPLHKLEE